MFAWLNFGKKEVEKPSPAVFHFHIVFIDGEEIDCTGYVSRANQSEWRCQTGDGWVGVKVAEIKYIIATQLTEGGEN